MELWSLRAREAIRDTFAEYTHTGDRFPLEGVADAFCDDGVLHAEGYEPARGRAEIEKFRSSTRLATGGHAADRLLRHTVSNILFESLTPTEAHVSSYYTVFSEVGLDHMGRYRDVFRPVGDRWLIAHRFATCDWRSPASHF